jgi:hypothetical protein
MIDLKAYSCHGPVLTYHTLASKRLASEHRSNWRADGSWDSRPGGAGARGASRRFLTGGE